MFYLNPRITHSFGLMKPYQDPLKKLKTQAEKQACLSPQDKKTPTWLKTVLLLTGLKFRAKTHHFTAE